ncbi:ClpXP protease specificity-enhancing factor [Paraglaciecola sp. MB-3u-78]|jgi:stringent starvation protein B|uniref:ClpXP protease specificity-enhancing factor n=1 Tax=Paraglaciecola sp. MB-3u-78 TaxID=2058332 RepID=UPI000C3310A9|nr:ClpXP protease specificity-enhancing factor [Paraglaciecola sp. MB-3u-78]PKH00281.1 ClpXP protease specificity-enhancing factor [Paraglaciecola sp. MB-3u-78]
MTPNQPYLLRAFYEWIVDNNLTPYIVVDAHYAGTQVPQEFVQDGQIVLNMSPASTGNLQLGLQDIMFDARFGGVPRNIVVPCPAVLAIYAKENGAGTVFTVEENIGSDEVEEQTVTDETNQKPKKGKPTLTVVK